MASSDEEIEEDDQKNDNEDIDMDEEPIGESQIQEIEQKVRKVSLYVKICFITVNIGKTFVGYFKSTQLR